MVHPKIVGVRLTGVNAPKPVIVPAELCTIKPSQFYKRKLSEDMVTKVVSFATLKPDLRRRMIEHGLGNDRNDQSPVRGISTCLQLLIANVVSDRALRELVEHPSGRHGYRQTVGNGPRTDVDAPPTHVRLTRQSSTWAL